MLATYLLEKDAHTRGYIFLGSLPRNSKPIWLNDNILITCAILKLVAASAAEVELGALFLNRIAVTVAYMRPLNYWLRCRLTISRDIEIQIE